MLISVFNTNTFLYHLDLVLNLIKYLLLLGVNNLSKLVFNNLLPNF